MAVRRLAEVQPESFSFTEENLAWAKMTIAKYPEGRQASAVVPLLWRAQQQHCWLPEPALRLVADMLEIPYIRLFDNATFYTMFQLNPFCTSSLIQVFFSSPFPFLLSSSLVSFFQRLFLSPSF